MINQVLKILTWVFYIMSALGALTSIIIFFKLRIREVIQDLNGTLAQKQIEQMRERNKKNDGGNVAQELFDKGLGETGNISRKNTEKAAPLTGEIKAGKAITSESTWTIGSLQNQVNTDVAQNGTTVLRSGDTGSDDFKIIRNIVYINTTEYI